MATPRKKPEDLQKRGRKPMFKPEYCEQARKYCLLGVTDKRLAELFEVSEKTLNNWKEKYPEFVQSLKAGKEIADATVADSLYQRANGYSHPEDDIRTVSLGGDAGSEIVITSTIKHYPPDTTAGIFWLKNRQRHAFRDRQEVEHMGEGGGPVQVEDLTEGDELAQARRIAFALAAAAKKKKAK